MPNTQHGGFLMVIQILCSISLPKSSCACLECNPPTNTNMYILGAQALVTMGTKQNCLHTQITQTLIRRLKKWDFELCKFQFKGGILLSVDVFVISPCLANKWFIKNGTAVRGLHKYYWVWSGPALSLQRWRSCSEMLMCTSQGSSAREDGIFLQATRFQPSLLKFLGFLLVSYYYQASSGMAVF